jgi:hypothetical protein
MARILFLHGLAGRPGGERVEALRERGHDVCAPILPFAESKTAGLMMSLVEQWQRDGGIADPLPRWTDQAQAACDDFAPDLVVGIGLGAALALRLTTDETPHVLLAPPWSGRVNIAAVAENLLPRLPAGMSAWLRPLLRYLSAVLETEPLVKLATVVMHSPADEVVDVEDSFRLLRRNPPVSSAERAYLVALAHSLTERGQRPLFRRLLLAGRNHACDCAQALTALADAVDAMLATVVAVNDTGESERLATLRSSAERDPMLLRSVAEPS